MRSSRSFRTNTVVISILLIFLSSVMPAKGADEIAEAKKILEGINIQSQEAEIYNKWDTYLKQFTGFTNAEYQSAIVDLAVEFARAISYLETCIKKAEMEKQYSSAWMKDFQKEFDYEYISRNLGSIKFILQSIYMRNWSNYYEAPQKEAIYKEIHYREVLKQYTQKFLKFSETLDKQSQEGIKDRIAFARVILEMPQYPMREMLISGDKTFLYSTALKNRKDIDPRLVGFYSKHPFFSKPFNLTRAAGEFKKYEKPE